MTPLTVITPCFYPDEFPIRHLRATCERFRIPLVPFGFGQQWRGTVGGDTYAQYTVAPDVIESLSTRLVMLTDGSDTFITRPPDEIVFEYESTGAVILLSAEPSLYPPWLEPKWAARFPHPRTPWCYPNIGGWIGPPEAVIPVLRHLAVSHDHTPEGQARWGECMAEHAFPVILDQDCRVFQTMSGGRGGALEVIDRVATNRVTGSRPAVLHWNGRLGGLEETYAKCFGAC